jgi:leucyl-tRNA synthetase
VVPQDHDYAEDLLAALDGLDRWPEKVRLMQRNWIGRPKACAFLFELIDADAGTLRSVEVFTTRPDTLFGASFIAMSPTIRWRRKLARTMRLAEFIAECRAWAPAKAAIEQAEKKGFDTGSPEHPFCPGWNLPVYVANFVLMEYGTGAIFGCPAHDQRDLDFARKYGPAGDPGGAAAGADPPLRHRRRAYVGDGTLFNSDFLDGLGVPRPRRSRRAAHRGASWNRRRAPGR